MTNSSLGDKALNGLNLHYWISIIALALLFVLIFFKIVQIPGTPRPIGIAIESYAIVITLAAIPIALKMFANKLRKISASGMPLPLAVMHYKTAYFIRLYMLVIVAGGNMALYGLSRNTNFLWLVVVLFVIFVFCKSSRSEISSVIKPDDAPNNLQE